MKGADERTRLARGEDRARLLIFITALGVFLAVSLGLSQLARSVSSSVSPALQPSAPLAIQQLRNVAAVRGIRLGVTDAGFGSVLYANTVPAEFSSITPESVMKFENIHPCPPEWLINSNPTVSAWVKNHGTDRPQAKYHCRLATAVADEWEWADTDARVAWANQNDVGFRGHTLLWASQNPGWLVDPSIVLSVAERTQIMDEHISQILERYCPFENVYQYDVVNEGLEPDGSLRPTPWSEIPAYMDRAYRRARMVLDQCGRGDVKLFYNDFEFEYGGEKADSIYAYLEALLLREFPTPIDGIGFQTHSQVLLDTSQPHDISALISTMNRFSVGLGLEVVITETDLPVGRVEQGDLFEAQAGWFASRMQACLLAQRCTGFTLWGTHDGASWRNSVASYGDVDPLMFEDAGEWFFDPVLGSCFPVRVGARSKVPFTRQMYCPKPAYDALYAVLVNGISHLFLPSGYRGHADGADSGQPDAYPPPVFEQTPPDGAYPAPGQP